MNRLTGEELGRKARSMQLDHHAFQIAQGEQDVELCVFLRCGTSDSTRFSERSVV
jgi:hypothetical protein